MKDSLAIDGTGRARLALIGRCASLPSLSDAFSPTGPINDMLRGGSAQTVESLSVCVSSSALGLPAGRLRTLILRSSCGCIRDVACPRLFSKSVAFSSVSFKVGMSGKAS